MPEDFLDRLNKPARAPAANLTPITIPAGVNATAYAQAALRGEVANITAVPIGSGRNHQLNISAMKMGQLVALGHIDEHTVTETLGAADGGLDYPATRRTIESGLAAGKAQGRVIPERQVPPWETSNDPFSDSASRSDRNAPGAPTSAKSNDAPEVAPNADSASTNTSSDTGASDDPNAVRDAYVYDRLPLINWHDLWADESAEEWIVEPLLPARRLVALYSPPKVGKSLIVLEIAAAISRGAMVLGYTPPRAYRVLYVDFENDPRGDVRQRLQNMHLKPDDLGNLCYLSFPTVAGLDTERGSQELLAAVETYRCEVVIIDTLSRSVDGDENENDTWLSFYRHTGLKLKQRGVSLLRLDHSGKDETKGQRGGSAKSGDVDAVWRMARLTTGADGQPEAFRLICEANRFPVLPADKLLTVERHENPLKHIIRPAGAQDLIVDAIIDYLDGANIPTEWSRDKIGVANVKQHVPGASQRTLDKAIRRRRGPTFTFNEDE